MTRLRILQVALLVVAISSNNSSGDYSVSILNTQLETHNKLDYFFKGQNFDPNYDLKTVAEKRIYSESIGNRGAAKFALENGYKKLLGSQQRHRAIPQGPDAIYHDPSTGKIVFQERKGRDIKYKNKKLAKKTFKSWQGTNLNALESIVDALKKDLLPNERRRLLQGLHALENGGTRSELVLTVHDNGSPQKAELKSTDQTSVSNRARKARIKLLKDKPALIDVYLQVKKENKLDLKLSNSNRGLAVTSKLEKAFSVLGVIAAPFIVWEGVNQTKEASEMFHDLSLSSTPLPYMQTGLAAGTLGLGITVSANSLASCGLLGEGLLYQFGKGAGKWILPLVIVVEALHYIINRYKYNRGDLSYHDFVLSETSSGIFMGSTVLGTGIGTAIGVWGGGVGAVPGAIAGATIGAVVGAVGQVGYCLYTTFIVDVEFSELQQQAVDVALEKYYGLVPLAD